ncbi:hypothetical protein [Neisseria sicca]|nr:hypothetical protein [Neisseria sicca]
MAENLCLGFGCRGKGFFAKVSGRLKTDIAGLAKNVSDDLFLCFCFTF